jgi:hypothetical protein
MYLKEQRDCLPAGSFLVFQQIGTALKRHRQYKKLSGKKLNFKT